MGYLKPLWVINEETNAWDGINEENFPCETQKVFVTAGYEAIDNAFPDGSIFSIAVHPNQQTQNPDYDHYCNFIAFGELKPGVPNFRRLEDKELIEIIKAPLPNPNQQQLLIDASPPLTHYITILENDDLFGIFEQKSERDTFGVTSTTVKLINTPLLTQDKLSRTILRTKIDKIGKPNLLRASINGESKLFIHNIIDMIRKSEFERQEYLSNEDLMKFGGEILEKTSPQAFKKSQIQLYTKNLANSPHSKHRPLLDKFFKVISEADEKSIENIEWMEKSFSSEGGRNVLGKIFEKYPEILNGYSKIEFSKKQAEVEIKLEKYVERQKELELKVRDTEAYLANLNRDLQLIETKKESISSGEITVLKNNLDNEISSKQIIIKNLDIEITEKKGELKDINKAHGIIDLISEKTLIRNHIDQEIKDMNERKTKVGQELSAPEYELKKKLFDMKPYVEALTGFTPEQDENSRIYKTVTAKVSKDEKDSLTRRDELVDNLTGYFNSESRQYSRQDVANLLISTQQSFITVVAGLPGVGKTSLVRLLSAGLGIESRLLEISVSRGWTSSRDLIGYFNPLTAKFQGSSTGFYDFVKQTHADQSSEDSNALVLLDEANLSPIEHYWSAFMGMSDNPSRGVLRVGNETFNLSKNIRFVATINYDNTTEPLSQRLIDRAPILLLGETNTSVHTELEPFEKRDGIAVYPSETMDLWFGNPSDDMSLTANDIRSLDEINQVCSVFNSGNGKPILLSPRKIDSVKRYCKRAHPIMRTERDNLALDYAVSQQILPLIDGQGDAYRNRLMALHGVLEKNRLEISLKALNRIVEFGKQDLDSYNFFSW